MGGQILGNFPAGSIGGIVLLCSREAAAYALTSNHIGIFQKYNIWCLFWFFCVNSPIYCVYSRFGEDS